MMLLDALLVGRIGVGMEKQDGDRLNALPDRVGDDAADLVLIERDQHGALGVDALADLVAQIPRDQRLVPLEEQVVGFRAVDAADLVDVAEALGGQQGAARAGALQERVDGDRGSVEEELGRLEMRAGLGDAVLDAVDQPQRRRQRLAEPQLAGRLVEGRDVREGPAHIRRQSKMVRGGRRYIHGNGSLR